jgi:hypothetical protein
MSDQSSDRKEFVARIGTFFGLVGLGLMIFFILSDASSNPRLSYFCGGTILLTLGFFLRGQFKKPAGPPSGRFGVLGRMKNTFKGKPKEEKKK